MAYRIIEIELTEPLPGIEGIVQDEGLAIVIRYQGRIAGFTMLSGPEVRSGDGLAHHISAEAGLTVMASKILDEIAPAAPPVAMPTLTVAICTRDRPELLARCLDSLGRLVMPEHLGGGNLELLVVDNAASGESSLHVTQMLVFHQHRQTMRKLRHQYWTWGLSVMAVAAKWYRNDPQMRQRWRLLILRWFEA